MQTSWSRRKFSQLQAVVFDWAGTTVDFGCQGPVYVFVHCFADFGITVTAEEARLPMGLGKREHVEAMLHMPRIAALWQEKHGREHAVEDIDALYACVESRMLSVITQYATPIDGVPETVAAMKAHGLRIGSCTGYPRDVAESLAGFAATKGYAPDCLVCATDVPQARPAGDMCEAILKQFGVSEPWRAVKIGDTVNDVLEGLDAKMWTIGLTHSSNLVGLSSDELYALPQARQEKLVAKATAELYAAGAHFVVPDVPHCLAIFDLIDQACLGGQRP